jgi:MFS family permease
LSQPDPPSPVVTKNEAPVRGWKATFFALSIRNYRYFWIGNLGSFFSSQMMQPTQAWLAYEITNSPLLLGLTWAAQGIPQMIVAPIGGVVIDRIQKRNLIMITQAAVIAINLAIAILISLGLIQFWHILVSSFLSGATNAFNMAARNSIVAELVPKDKMYNAIALNNGGANIARIAGPALAGVLIGFVGTQGAYYFGIVFNVAAIVTVSLLPPTSKLSLAKSHTALSNLKDGFSYLKVHNIILILLLLEVGLTIFGMCYMGLMPVLAKVLNVDSIKYGLMMSAVGIGSLTGAIGMASLGNFKHKGLAMLSVGIAFGLALVILGNAVNIGSWLNLDNFTYTFSLICLAVIGLSSTAYTATSLTIFQMYISDEYRGRMTSMYQIVIAIFPFSVLISGAVANAVGVEMALTIGGACLAVFMLAMMLFIPKIKKLE